MPSIDQNAKTPLTQSDDNEHLSVIIKGGGLNLIGTIIRTGLLYSYTLIIAKIAGAKVFGEYSLALALISILAIFSEMGLGKGIIKYIGSFQENKNDYRVRNALQSALITGIIISLLSAFFLFVFANAISTHIFHEPHLTSTLKFFAIGIPVLVISNVLISFTQALKKMRYKFYYRDFIQPSAELVIALLLLGTGLQATGLAISYATSFLLVAVLLIFAVGRLFPLFFDIRDVHYYSKTLVGSSVPIMGGDLILNILPRISTFIIAITFSIQMVGVYNIVLRINMIQVLILTSFNLIFAPIISELYEKGEIDQLKKLFTEITTLSLWLSAPIFGVCVLFPSFILQLFGDEFVMGNTSLAVLSIGRFVSVFTGSVTYILIMVGRTKEYFGVIFGAMMLSIILGATLIPHFGLFGAALADSIIQCFINILMLFIVYKKINIHPYTKKIFRPLFALVTAGIIAMVFSRQDVSAFNLPSEGTGIIIFITLYFILTFSKGYYRKIFNLCRV